MLTLTVGWISGTYEAALDDGPEWPPHPARVFCALVSAARENSPDDDALRWLEAQAPPAVLASTSRSCRLPTFVPTNQVAATASNRIARTNGRRQWERTNPKRPLVHLLWEEAEPSPEVLARLDRLARRIPFIGRSTSQAVVAVTEAMPADVDVLDRHEHGGDKSDRLRIPYPGYLDALRAAFDDGAPARSANRWAVYGAPRRDNPPLVHPADGPWPDLVTLAFERGIALDGRLAIRVATSFKKAVLEQLGRGLSGDELGLLNGHHDGTRRQCAFLALPFVGRTYASGSILGVGVAMSQDVPPHVRRSILRLLGFDQDAPRLRHLRVPGLTTSVGLRLHHADGRATVRAATWTRPASTWATVYPIVLDRFPHRGDHLADHVANSCEMAGFPRPRVEITPGPSLLGTPQLRRSDLRRRRDSPQRPAVHAVLHFQEAVQGPVVVGHLRHLGIGLCAPRGQAREAQRTEGDDA